MWHDPRAGVLGVRSPQLGLACYYVGPFFDRNAWRERSMLMCFVWKLLSGFRRKFVPENCTEDCRARFVLRIPFFWNMTVRHLVIGYLRLETSGSVQPVAQSHMQERKLSSTPLWKSWNSEETLFLNPISTKSVFYKAYSWTSPSPSETKLKEV
jgi:hypothetical protein